MKSRNIQGILTLLTAVLIVIIGTGAAFAQGKGRGGGNNGGGEKRGGGQSEQPRGQVNKAERQQSAQERPQMQRQERPQMQRQERPQMQRQERPQMQRQERPQMQRQERPQAQREQQREQRWPMQQQQRQEQPQRQQVRRPNDVRSEQRRQAPQEIPDYRAYDQRRNRVERMQREGTIRNQRGDDYRSQFPVQQRTTPWSNATPNNYGYQRSREVHERNAERKAWKNEEKALRRLGREERSYSGAYQPDYYYNDPYAYQYPEHRRANVLRNVISIVLGSNSGYYDNNYPQYQPAYYGNSYDPGYYGNNYYTDYPLYQSYAAAPYYYNYQPYADIYYPQYGGDQYYGDTYSGYPQYGYYTDSAPSGGFVQRLFSRLLALGYEQGFNDGLTARRSGYGDRYYSDPYEYENSDYVPYSYAVGTNRRSLSDGYELGYNDALYDQRGSNRYENGNIDLVSLLIGSALQIL